MRQRVLVLMGLCLSSLFLRAQTLHVSPADSSIQLAGLLAERTWKTTKMVINEAVTD